MDKNCKSEEKMGHIATYHSRASLSAARLQAFIQGSTVAHSYSY